jgi:hypothetical protein
MFCFGLRIFKTPLILAVLFSYKLSCRSVSYSRFSFSSATSSISTRTIRFTDIVTHFPVTTFIFKADKKSIVEFCCTLFFINTQNLLKTVNVMDFVFSVLKNRILVDNVVFGIKSCPSCQITFEKVSHSCHVTA